MPPTPPRQGPSGRSAPVTPKPTTALVDRFVQHCHTLDIEAESWRQKESELPPGTGPKKPRLRR
jgi:hypothetical protein